MTALLTVVVILCIAYGAMVITFWFGVIKLKKEKTTTSDENIPISIVVAFRNEAQNLTAFLSSIERLKYPENLYEVILVNDHSTDHWQVLLNEWISRLPNLKLINLEGNDRGKKYALTLGVKSANNEYIALTDADCILPENWLRNICTSFTNTKTALTIGPVVLRSSGSFFDQLQALENSSLSASTLGACSMGFPFMASSANLAFDNKQLNFKLKLLNPKTPSGDDVFLLHAAIAKGLKISCHLNTGGAVETEAATTLKTFLNQRARWASKAKHYRNPLALMVAVIVLLFNISLLTVAILATFTSLGAGIFIFSFAIKLLVDLLLLNSYLKVLGQQKLLLVYLPLQLVYPFYIFIAFVLSIIKPVQWK